MKNRISEEKINEKLNLEEIIAELLNNNHKKYNVVIEVDEEGSMKYFTTYSAVLRRSPYFDKELENTTIKIILDLLLSQKPKLFTNADELDLKNLTIDDLKKIYNDIIVNYPNLIFDSGDFTSLKETALISILKRDYLKVLYTTYSYFLIPNEVIWKKVKPNKKILEKQLWDDIILHSVHKGTVNSLILPSRIVSNPGLPSRTISTPDSDIYMVKSLILKIQKPKLFTNADELDLKNLTIDDLKKIYNDIIVNYPNLIFDSGDFTSLKETALISILKRDYLKNGLMRFSTPLIRYFLIPNEVIWKKVKPNKKILEKQLWDDIILHSVHKGTVNSLILPSRIVSNPGLNEPFSSIINIEYVIELSPWIDKKSTYSSANIPYDFELILRGRDGFIPRHFRTFAGTDEIVGDYNPLTWDNLKDDNMEINDLIDSSVALFNPNSNKQDFYGPWFGVSEFTEVSNFTHDKLGFGINLIIMISLTIRTTTEHFSIIDYELFEIIK
ncbi:hypothetical protein Glove_552g14 [Diversispora epigaea]|uniref:TLDc domain-containing protein n=1 Tax=Diversispora epigaea TaxID=1348612 RepID=A0A397GBL9_9GLOM|nr:hypothetical protein Glove_552g14 [Diversispora epigaea]